MARLHSLTYGPALRQAINGAGVRIWVSSYVVSFNFRKKNDLINIIMNSIRSQLEKGLDIRMLIDRPRLHKTNYHVNKFLMRRLMEWRIPFWVAPARTTCHAKVVLIDDNTAFLGSHNLARSSFKNPLELSIETNQADVISGVTRWFEGKFQDPAFEYFPPGDYVISDIYP